MANKKEDGFTLIELIVVVGIVGIMSAVAVPSFLSWLPDIRLKAAARDLYGASMLAKGEAVKRNRNCALTFNQQIGATTYVYIVFEDSDGDCEYDAGEILLKQVQQWPRQVMLDLTMGGGDGVSYTNNDDGNPTIVFRSNAIPTGNGGGFANGSAFLTNTNNRSLSVVISRSGNISIQ